MFNKKPSAQWLPIGFDYKSFEAAVEWLDFGKNSLAEPFFHNTVHKLKSGNQPAASKHSTLEALVDEAVGLPAISPSGIIAHISRCGSTLLVNALQSGRQTLVFSEALAIMQLIHNGIPQGPTDARVISSISTENAISSILKLYARHSRHPNPKIVIKLQAISIMQLSSLRLLWPDVPFVVVIRDPVEVAISNLEKPTGWTSIMLDPLAQKKAFGYSPHQVQKMTMEEFCVKGISAFLSAALQQMDDNCWVVDYTELCPRIIHRVASVFGLELPAADSSTFMDIMRIDAKDASRQKLYEQDSLRKQAEASESLRVLSRRWAIGPYLELLQKRRLSVGGAFDVHQNLVTRPSTVYPDSITR